MNTFVFIFVINILLTLLCLKCSCKSKEPYLIQSKFDKLPPTINFPEFGKCQKIPQILRNYLKVPTETRNSKIVVNKSWKCADLNFVGPYRCARYTKYGKTIGFYNVAKGCKSKEPTMKQAPYQKRYNSFPDFRQFGDKIAGRHRWSRFANLTNGKNNEFILKSYELPKEYNQFVREWKKQKDKLWIVKPNSGPSSKGVRLISKPIKSKQGAEADAKLFKKRRDYIIEKYLSNPWLFQNKKIEYRFVVLVTRFQPLRIYTFPKINRFRLQGTNYTTKKTSRCIHIRDWHHCKSLGNDEYCIGCDVLNAMEREGGKGTVSRVMDKIYLYVSQILLQWESELDSSIKYSHGSYHILTFDWLFESKTFQPKLVEINSNRIEFPGLYWIEQKYFPEIFRIVGHNLPPFIPSEILKELNITNQNPLFYKYWEDELSESEISKQAKYNSKNVQRTEYLSTILNNLTRDDIVKLIESEDEFSRVKEAKRIFPSLKMYQYFTWMSIQNTYYYKLMDAWETKYWNNRSSGISYLNSIF